MLWPCAISAKVKGQTEPPAQVLMALGFTMVLKFTHSLIHSLTHTNTHTHTHTHRH